MSKYKWAFLGALLFAIALSIAIILAGVAVRTCRACGQPRDIGRLI